MRRTPLSSLTQISCSLPCCAQPSRFVELIFRSEYDFYICEYVIVELFKHKDRLMKYTQLSEDDLLRLLYRLLKRLNIFPERLLDPAKLAEAATLCAPVDENDTVHVALCSHWTDYSGPGIAR